MFVVMVCGSALAQMSPGNVADVYYAKVKASAAGDIDKVIKAHYEWHRQQKDTWSWFMWQVMSGDHMGDFWGGSFGHRWKEFDDRAKFNDADGADFVAHVLPSLESISEGYWEMMPKASRPTSSQTPSPMAQVTHYYVKTSDVVAFTDALEEITAALNKANWPVHSTWYRLVSGGRGPQFVLATDRNSFAEMEGPAKSLEQAVSEVLNPHKAAALFDTIRGATDHTYSELLVYRPDLSYIAGK
jgi:hypothetical protein